MYLLPSISTSVAPEARAMKSGEPPTDLNARTGLSTPPGSSCCAREKSFCDRVVFMETTLCHSTEKPRSRDSSRLRGSSVALSALEFGIGAALDKSDLLACHRRETRTGERPCSQVV